MDNRTQHAPDSETNQTPLPWGGAGGGFSRIILIGYMGAGKTTVGKALSKELGIPFYDLDWYIQSTRRKTIPQIFAEQGEEGCRKIEYNMLHELADFEDVIISCGGGTPCFFDNIDYMNQQGQVVYLRCEPEVLQKHLMMGKTERPLLKDKSPEQLIGYIKEHLQEREPFYNKARFKLDVSLMDNYEKISITVAQLRKILAL